VTDELRREVNKAFDQGQAELGDLHGVRDRLLRAGLAARGNRSDNRLQLAASLAIVLIAALVVATFVYVRAGNQLIPGGMHRPRPSPTPLTQPLDVPDKTPVIRYHDLANFNQIDAMTWDGKNFGTADWGSGFRVSNPAVNLFAKETTITDREGRVVLTGDFRGIEGRGAWADDGTSYCQMAPDDPTSVYGPADNKVPSTLQLVKFGLPPRNVAHVGSVVDYPRVVACGVIGDRAVVLTVGAHGTETGYSVVELSTGKIVWTHTFDESQLLLNVLVVASPDGQYVAENTLGPGGSATIYGRDGSVLARLPAIVKAFSWDGSLVVTEPEMLAGPVSVVRWKDGSVVWAGPTGAGFGLREALPEPDGTSLAIGIEDPAFPVNENENAPTFGYIPVDLYVIASDGHVILRMNDIHIVQVRDIY
jgi:hypothetical protein